MSLAFLESLIRIRAQKFAEVRSFFNTLGVVEADPFALSAFAPVIDVHIDPIKVVDQGKEYFLHTSPEFGLKRLIAKSELDLYFLGHVFRSKELSQRHCPEFTMVEWYRLNSNEILFIEEVMNFLTLFIPRLPYKIYHYSDLLMPHLHLFDEVQKEHPNWDISCIKDYIFSFHVQPFLGANEISIVTSFPEEDAALAKLSNGIASRYEFFYQSLELGNGYHELTDPKIHQDRFEENNKRRIAMGKDPLPIDHHFIQDITDFPLKENTYGIAIGFDRLLMIHQGANSLHDILPLPWSLSL
jgi:lysyl-tRNA synthetase class 2